MKFVQLAKHLKEEGLRPLYVAEGAEAYFRDHAVLQIRAACNLTQPLLNDVRYEGETLKGDRLREFAAELATLPLFDERRLVRIYEFYPSDRDWETFLGAFSAASATVVVIVNALTKKTADFKKRKEATYVDCAKEGEEMLAKWLYKAAGRKGLTMDGDAVSLMLRYTDYDAARMTLELEKLALLLGADGRVRRETIEAYVAKDVKYRAYELSQAASGGNRIAFFTILHDLREKGFDENDVLSTLLSHFRSLAEIADMGGSDEVIGKSLGLHPYAVKKNRETIMRLGKERARSLYLRLYALSADMKSGLYTKSGALYGAICEIFFGESPQTSKRA